MVISDGNKGIREAVKQSFPGASWQYCHVHFMRNLRKLMGKQQWKDISLLVKQALDNPDILPVLQDNLIDKGLDKCSTMFDRYYDSLYNYRSFNTNIQGLRRLRVSNTIERLNCEIQLYGKMFPWTVAYLIESFHLLSRESGKSIREISQIVGIKRSTVYDIIKSSEKPIR